MTTPRAAIAAMVLPMALAACGGGGDGPGDDSAVLYRGNTAEPFSLDPHQASGVWENNIISDMIIGLYQDDAAGEPIPGMATGYEVSEDGLAWTFTLREAEWSDGVPVTAQDFVFSMRRILDPATIAQYASLLYGIKNAEAVNKGQLAPEELGVSAPDDRTLVIELEYPAPYLPSLLTHYTTYPVPAHVVEEYGSRWIQPENAVFNGPYLLEEWRSNAFVHLVRNPNFYEAETICFDEVYYYPTTDANAAVRRVRAGELDLNTSFPGQQVEELEEQLPGFVHVYPYLNTVYYAPYMPEAPWDDVRVRRALSMSLDRQFMVDEILRTGQRPTSTLVPPGIANYEGVEQADWWDEDMDTRREEARQLLMEAGFGPDNPLAFEFTYRNSGNNPRVAPVVQQNWEAIADWVQVSISGIEVQIQYDNLRTGNFEVGDAGWVADYNDAQNYLYLLESRTGSMNYGRYSNPEYDALIAESNRELDPERRSNLLARAERMMLDDVAIIPMWNDTSRNLVDPEITGWEDNVSDKHRTRFLCRPGLEPGGPAAAE